MLRIDVNRIQSPFQYGIPADNPYVGRAGYDEIWARGFRNPWRFSFDRRWGVLWVGDVGQGRIEEVNRATPWDDALGRGQNYGWRILEGSYCYNPPSCSPAGTVLPMIQYSHIVSGDDNCSVTGGYAYRGAEFPALYGSYLFGDLCSGRIWGIWVSAARGTSPRQLLDTGFTISSFGEGEDGSVYVVDYNGKVYKLIGTPR
jgi:glucose/arabinose dehydrogenase